LRSCWRWSGLLTPRDANFCCPYRFRKGRAWVIQTCYGGGWWPASCCGGRGVLVDPSAADGFYCLEPVRRGPSAADACAVYIELCRSVCWAKTEFSMAMFSNLRCQNWNHFVIPDGWRIFNGAEYATVRRDRGPADDGGACSRPCGAGGAGGAIAARLVRVSALLSFSRVCEGFDGRPPNGTKIDVRLCFHGEEYSLSGAQTKPAAWASPKVVGASLCSRSRFRWKLMRRTRNRARS